MTLITTPVDSPQGGDQCYVLPSDPGGSAVSYTLTFSTIGYISVTTSFRLANDNNIGGGQCQWNVNSNPPVTLGSSTAYYGALMQDGSQTYTNLNTSTVDLTTNNVLDMDASASNTIVVSLTGTTTGNCFLCNVQISGIYLAPTPTPTFVPTPTKIPTTASPSAPTEVPISVSPTTALPTFTPTIAPFDSFPTFRPVDPNSDLGSCTNPLCPPIGSTNPDFQFGENSRCCEYNPDCVEPVNGEFAACSSCGRCPGGSSECGSNGFSKCNEGEYPGLCTYDPLACIVITNRPSCVPLGGNNRCWG